MLVVVRHGQTAANARGLLLGRSDPPLSEVGRRQAAALARALPANGRVISSPLRRARETAATLGRSVEIDDRWVELDYGDLDGSRPEDVAAAVWADWRRDPAYVPEGGESLEALGRRVRESCEELASEAASSDVVVVTHVSPIKATVAWALGAGDEIAWRLYVLDASIVRIGCDGAGPVLLRFNEVPPAD